MSDATESRQSTRLSRSWKLKMLAFLVVSGGIGVWGLLDATVVYPRSGEAFASLKLKEYLERSKEAGRLMQAKVTEPRRDLEELRNRRSELAAKAASTGPEGRIAAMELAKHEWLESLAVMGRLDSAASRIEPSPESQLAALQAEWKTRPNPKALSRFDIPVQWLITAIGFAVAAGVLASWVRAGTKRFTWDAGEKRLTLPGGASFTPADVKEFDKRNWHKFFVTVVIREDRGGGRHRLDLLRYTPLEEWVLEMERTAFPESAGGDNGEARSTDRGGATGGEERAADRA
jgi:hypothetical protein